VTKNTSADQKLPAFLIRNRWLSFYQKTNSRYRLERCYLCPKLAFMANKLPLTSLGESDFKSIRDQNRYYVDKTSIIRAVHESNKVLIKAG
jgi:hypothetical protein